MQNTFDLETLDQTEYCSVCVLYSDVDSRSKHTWRRRVGGNLKDMLRASNRVLMDDDGAHICQVTVYAMLTSSEVNKAESRKTASICRTLFLMLCPDFLGPNTCALSLYYLKVMLVE